MKNINIFYACFHILIIYSINYCCASSMHRTKYDDLISINHNKRKNIKKFSERYLEPEGNNNLSFVPLSIYLITDEFNETIPADIKKYQENFILAMNKAKNILEDFLEILIDLEGNPFYIVEHIPNLDVSFQNKLKLSEINFFILTKFDEINDEVDSVIVDEYTAVPFIGLVVFNTNINTEDKTKFSTEYLTNLFLHHFIRLIGLNKFMSEEPLSYIPVDENNNYYLTTDGEYNFTNVINYAQKYFNCSKIDRIDLFFTEENDEEPIEYNEDNYFASGLYWPKRLFLGELMTKFDYKEEVALSGFTLAFLDDLPYLRVKKNYANFGGLMKFGKNKGCEFFFNHCGNASNSLTTFANEFYLPKESTVNSEPSCSSGRLSKTIYNLQLIEDEEINDNANIFEYLISDNKGGSKETNYCPIAHYDESINYIGSCSDSSNENINSLRDEKYGNNSFCVISSLEKVSSENENSDYTSICYEMFCTSLSLTIKIGENYIVCPREGGQIKAKGFNGYLLCPDYNLICTSTILCNSLLNCFEKNSEEIEETFYYDYEIKTTQNSSIYNIDNPKINYGWELTQEGSCPYQCMQCLSKDDCIRCRPHYIFENNECIYAIDKCIDFENDENDICTKCEEGYFLAEVNDKRYCEIESEKLHFYEFDNELHLYKKCEESKQNCDKCSYTDSILKCTQCKNPFKEIDDGDLCGDLTTQLYYEDTSGVYKSCSKHETVLNCNKCEKTSEIFTCLECEENYILYYNSLQPVCLNKDDINNSMYTSDGKKYYSCTNSLYNDIPHCLECDKKEDCNKCNSDYTLSNGNKLCIYTQDISDKKYYQDPDDNNYYYECSKSLEHCLKCENKQTCIECITSYVVEENGICIPYSLYSEQLYYLDNGKYYSCSKIKNCEKCTSKDQCILCKYGFNLIKDNDNNIVCENIDISKYYQITEGEIKYYSKCDEAIDNCDECSSSTYCTKCKNNFGIIEDDHTKCENLLDEKYYYNSDTNKYNLCSNIMANCELCSTYGEFECKKCFNDYAFKHMNDINIECERKTFFDNNINYYHDDSEENYYSCAYFNIAKNCLECSNKDICEKCSDDYELHNSNTLCASKTDIENNMYAYNPLGKLMTCNDLIQDCKQCHNSSSCYNCYDESVLLEDDTCLEKNIINENNNYILDETINKYISCSIIDNCFSCVSKTECTSCQNGYALNNNKFCDIINNEDDNNLSIGAIIGIVFGCLGFLVFVALIVYYLLKKVFKKNDNLASNEAQNNIQITEGKKDKIQDVEDIEENSEKEVEKNKIIIHKTRRSIHNNIV